MKFSKLAFVTVFVTCIVFLLYLCYGTNSISPNVRFSAISDTSVVAAKDTGGAAPTSKINSKKTPLGAKELLELWCADATAEDAQKLQERFAGEPGVLAAIAIHHRRQPWGVEMLRTCLLQNPNNPDVLACVLLSGMEHLGADLKNPGMEMTEKLFKAASPYTSIALLFQAKFAGAQGDPTKVLEALALFKKESDPSKLMDLVRSNEARAWKFLGRDEDGIMARQLLDSDNTYGKLVSDVIGQADPSLWLRNANRGDGATRALVFDALDRATHADLTSFYGYLDAIALQDRLMEGTPDADLSPFLPDVKTVKSEIKSEWKETALLDRSRDEFPLVFNQLDELEKGYFVEEIRQQGEVKAWKNLFRNRPELFLNAPPDHLTPTEWKTLFDAHYPYPKASAVGADVSK